jgi:hypothetical protein
VNSGGAITCAVVTDATSASTNLLRWSVAASSTTGKKAKLTRFVAVAGSQNRAFVYIPEITFFPSATTANVKTNLNIQYYKADQTTTTGTAVSSSLTFVNSLQTLRLTSANLAPTPSAAYALITIEIETTATSPASVTTCDLYEVNLYDGKQVVAVAEDNAPAVYSPSTLTQSGGVLTIYATTSVAIANSTAVTGDLTATGDITTAGDIGFDGVIYGTSALSGPNINLAGTNARLWAHSGSAADVAASTSTTISGVLITKATAGQPSTNINGTATTDAFSDALRNGGIAVDTTNNRGYFYSGGWKYAALTTPSDSRLKEEITDITGALDTLRQLVPVAFKWKRPEAHGRSDAVADDGTRLGFIADQVATTDLAHWVETLGVDEREADLVDTTEVLAVNIPQNEMEALVVQALLDIDARLKALEER